MSALRTLTFEAVVGGDASKAVKGIADDTDKLKNKMQAAEAQTSGLSNALKLVGAIGAVALAGSIANASKEAFGALEKQTLQVQALTFRQYPMLKAAIDQADRAGLGNTRSELLAAGQAAASLGPHVRITGEQMQTAQKLAMVFGRDLSGELVRVATAAQFGGAALYELNRDLAVADVMGPKVFRSYAYQIKSFENATQSAREVMGEIFVQPIRAILLLLNPFLNWLTKSERGMAILKTAAIALSVVLGGAGLVAAIFAVNKAMLFLAANPVVLTIAAIVAGVTVLILIIEDLYVGLTGGEAFFTGWKKYLLLLLGPIGWLLTSVSKLAEGIKYLLESGAVDKVIGMVKGLAGAVGGLFGGGSGPAIEARAAGGPVTARTPYMVGENGPELFVPQVSGAIMPNTGAASVAAAPGGNISVTIGPITIQTAAQGEAGARDLFGQFERLLDEYAQTKLRPLLGVA